MGWPIVCVNVCVNNTYSSGGECMSKEMNELRELSDKKLIERSECCYILADKEELNQWYLLEC